MRSRNILQLGLKELYSLKADPVLIALIIYIFTIAVYAVATGMNFEVRNAAVAVVDEDNSALSRQMRAAFLPPYFKPAVKISAREMDSALENGDYVFVVVFPPDMERNLLLGKSSTVQVNIDASAMTQAGNGAVYIQQILSDEAIKHLMPGKHLQDFMPLNVDVRKLFNPNSESRWFNAVMQVINSITILGIILTGAALIREREHGTVEHLLVMPVRPSEIMLAKIWANGVVILICTLLSLLIVVREVLAVPVQGSIVLFSAGALLYLFSVTALGIMLATLARSMAQFGLLVIPVIVIMYLLSGSTTPMESMPDWLRWMMQLSPSTHFIAFAQAILYRGAGFSSVWHLLLLLAGVGALFFSVALLRFRKAIVSMG